VLHKTGSEYAAIVAMTGFCHETKKIIRFNFNGLDLDDREWGFIFYFLGPNCHRPNSKALPKGVNGCGTGRVKVFSLSYPYPTLTH
jgi:hypothetical protein